LHDQPGRPSKGRSFPLQFAHVLGVVATHGLKDEQGARLPVILRNPSPSEAKERLVAAFRPRRYLALVSLAAQVPSEDASHLWEWVLETCPKLDARRTSPNTGHGPVYALVGSQRPLVILERWYHYQTRKYRGTDKFTGGLNRKLLRVDEKRVVV
jgi:hypothetical protein